MFLQSVGKLYKDPFLPGIPSVSESSALMAHGIGKKHDYTLYQEAEGQRMITLSTKGNSLLRTLSSKTSSLCLCEVKDYINKLKCTLRL